MTTVKLPSGNSLEIEDALYAFVRDGLTPGTGKTVDEVFSILGALVLEFEPKNLELLEKRTARQAKIDEYYVNKRKAGWEPSVESGMKDASDLGQFLVSEGFLESEAFSADPRTFNMTTPELDFEMSQNGPELVTPVNIASMAVGGANARWGSLYDAYFLSDIHSEIDRDLNRVQRLQMVVDCTNQYLDEHVAQWEEGRSFSDMMSYVVRPNSNGKQELIGITVDLPLIPI